MEQRTLLTVKTFAVDSFFFIITAVGRINEIKMDLQIYIQYYGSDRVQEKQFCQYHFISTKMNFLVFIFV